MFACMANTLQIEPSLPPHKCFSFVNPLIFSAYFTTICEQIDLKPIQGYSGESMRTQLFPGHPVWWYSSEEGVERHSGQGSGRRLAISLCRGQTPESAVPKGPRGKFKEG